MNQTEIKISNKRLNPVCIKINSQKINLKGFETTSVSIPSKKIQIECFQFGLWLLKSRKQVFEDQDALDVKVLKYNFSKFTFLQFITLCILIFLAFWRVQTKALPLELLIFLVFNSLIQIIFVSDVLSIKQIGK